jgi:hypothetical protein
MNIGLTNRELHMVEDDPVIEDWVWVRRTAPEEHDNDVLEAFGRFCLRPTLRGGKDEQRSRGD